MTQDPKNILYLSSFGNLRWGGQKSLYHLVTRLDSQKYQPYVLLPTDEDFAAALRKQGIGVVVHNLPAVTLLNPLVCLSSIRYLTKLIDDYRIALIHTDGPRNTFYAGLSAKLKHRPLVWHIRSSEKDRYDPLLVPLCTKIILVASALRRRFAWTKNDAKFTTIHNGVDLSEFDKPSSACTNIRLLYDLDDDAVLIGSFARIEALKGQLNLIEACAKIENSFRFRLFLYGDIFDRKYYQTCIEKLQKLGLQGQVIFGNHQVDVVSIMKSMDLVVLASTFAEAFPRSIIEAMAAAKPVIVTDVGGSAEAVEEAVSGFVVTPRDVVMLADRIIRLGRDKDLRRKFGEAARMRVEARFTVEKNVRKTEQVYRELLEEGIP
jgi:glycosyltransferase involved in cell wall biosynthesis